jgi:hypothetical protein
MQLFRFLTPSREKCRHRISRRTVSDFRAQECVNALSLCWSYAALWYQEGRVKTVNKKQASLAGDTPGHVTPGDPDFPIGELPCTRKQVV